MAKLAFSNISPMQRKKKKYKKICSPSIFEEYQEAWKNNFPNNPPRHNGRDLRLLKLLIEEQGAEEARDLILNAVFEWNNLDIRNLDGYPTIAVLYGFRFTIIKKLQGAGNRKNSVVCDMVRNGHKTKKKVSEISIGKLFVRR